MGCHRRVPRALAWTGALLLFTAGCGARERQQEARGVLVIAVDALRADHVSVLGYDRPTTHALDELASEGLLFRQAFASSPLLLPSHVALMTGCEPNLARRTLASEEDGTARHRWRIPKAMPELAVELLGAGYATAAFIDDPRLSESFGFGRGFQHYEILEQESAEVWEGDQSKRVVDRFLQWLRSLDAGRSWFAYLHLHELDRFWSQRGRPWDDYFTPRPELEEVPPVGNTDAVFFAIPRSRWRGSPRTLGQYESAYDGEIRLLDAELDRLFASLRHAGRFDSASIHVVGTHGIQFGEAGLYLSAGRYSQADLHVPWVFRPRSGLEAGRGRAVDAVASLVDLAPTVLDLEGLPPPAGMSGVSQAGWARGPEAPPEARRFAFASCGLQEGCAVIDARRSLEVLVPQGVGDQQLRRSWFGGWVEMDLGPRLCFYDRVATPYPRLADELVPGQEEELAPFRTAILEWLRKLEDGRVLLQAPAGSSALEGKGILDSWR